MSDFLCEESEMIIDATTTVDPVLARLADAIQAEGARTVFWREHELSYEPLDEDEVVGVQTGQPEPSLVEDFYTRYLVRTQERLPPLYVGLLLRFHGISIDTMSNGACGQVPSSELSEPLIWPLECYGDHFVLEGVDLDGIQMAFAFGSLPDCGYLAFDVCSDSGDDAPVFWIPRRFSSEASTRLAPSLRQFIDMLCEQQLHFPSVLKVAKTPGWGA
jgi:hypothetical protein